MEYVIRTNRGIEFDIDTDMAGLEDLRDKLNNHTLITINISGIILNKANVQIVEPRIQPEPGENAYILSTMDGFQRRVEIKDYDASVISQSFNNPRAEFIIVGGVLMHKRNLNVLQKELEG